MFDYFFSLFIDKKAIESDHNATYGKQEYIQDYMLYMYNIKKYSKTLISPLGA